MVVDQDVIVDVRHHVLDVQEVVRQDAQVVQADAMDHVRDHV